MASSFSPSSTSSSTTTVAGNVVGLSLALGSCFFIGSSFIMKKKGLKRAGVIGLAAGSGGHSYLLEPLWWAGMITMIVGEIANFAAYAFAPAVLVTPLGAGSIIISAVLAHVFLGEKLHALGILGCFLSVVGAVIMAMHAPTETTITSVKEIWELATQPAFVVYALSVFATALVFILFLVPHYGRKHVLVCITICSLAGSLMVMSVRALGIAIRLTLEGQNQMFYPYSWVFLAMVIACGLTQMNYLNKALDIFDTAVVSLIYYVMFTSFTIFASVIMYKTWHDQSTTSILSEVCGFFIILSGMILLLATKNLGEYDPFEISLYFSFSPSLSAQLIRGNLSQLEYTIK